MRFVKVYSDDRGDSHFAEEFIETMVEWDGKLTRLVRVAPGRTSPLHPEPRARPPSTASPPPSSAPSAARSVALLLRPHAP
ncbi:MAG: hypothetical protein ABI134_06700 [Byssovorax sp.]